jgi:uroporphyrinogen III methyltransferase/synthase
VSARLAGRRVLVTRASGQSTALVAMLTAAGATVSEVPAIEIAPPADPEALDAALRGLERYAWVAFTSANAVRAVRQRLEALGLGGSIVARGPRLAVVGSTTSDAVHDAFPADQVAIQPEAAFSAQGLLAALAGDVAGRRVLLPVSDRARPDLARGLRELGAEVDVVTAYRTLQPRGLAELVAAALDSGFDVLTFASPSAVEGFAAVARDRVRDVPAAVIGPVTEAAARAAGFAVRAVASPSTAAGLVRALEDLFAPRRS